MTILFINLPDHVVSILLDNKTYVRGHHVSVFNFDTCYKITITNRVCLLYL